MTQPKPDFVYPASKRSVSRIISIMVAFVCMSYSGLSSANPDLFDAARSGDTTRLEQALSSGVDINMRDEDGYTALMWAARRGHLSAVRLLNKKGADLQLRTPAGSSAYKLATNFGRYDVADYLKQEAREQRRSNKLKRRNNRNISYAVRLSICDKKIDVNRLVKRAFFDLQWDDIVAVDKTTVSASLAGKRGRVYRARSTYDPKTYTVTLMYTDELIGKRAWLARVGKKIRSHFSDSCF